jgi:GT2 family glycosyltransferase
MMLIDRELFKLIGSFDRRFFMFMEDTDLCLRLTRSGFSNYFVPAAGGTHAWGQGSNAGRLRRNWYHHSSVWKYFLKHVPNGFSIIWLPLLLTINFILTALFTQNATHRGAGA